MARALLFLLTVLLCNLLPSAPLDAQSPGEQALSTLRESLERNAPALEGTEEEKGRIDALTAFFEPLEVPLERANVSTGPTVHTFAEYLIAHPEALPLDSLVVVVPLDAPVESILLGARLAAHPSVAERGPSVIFLGGADREEVGPTWLSSRISGLPGVQQVAILNFSRLERGMLVEAGTAGDVAPFYMLQAARDLSDRELRFALAGNKLQLARLGLAMPEEPLGALLSRGVPAVQLTNNDDPGVSRWISRRLFGEDRPVSPERMVEALIGLREELPSQGPWERNYVALQAGPVYLLLGETALLAVGGVPLISMLLYGTFKPWRVRRYARIMGKNFRQLPLLFGAVAVYLLISTTLIEAIAVARVFPSLVTYAPAITFSAKLLITITLFGLSHEALRKALFSRNSSFYSGWALFLQLLALLVLLVSNLALSFYFVWTLTLTFLFGFVGYPWLKRLIFFFALLPPLAFVFSILAPGETIMAGALINSPAHATFLIALFLLPYLLMLFRLDLLRRAVPGRRMAPHTVARRTVTAVLGALGLGVLLFYDPFGADRPVPVSLEEQLAEEHTLSITAPRPLVGGRVRVAGVERAEWQERTRSLELPLDRAPEVFEVELQRREFLRRTQLRYTITTPDRLESVTITLSGVPELTILESRFPVIEGDGETTLIVGANPPNPLLVELVVEGNQAPDLMLDAKLRRTVSQIGITSDEPVSVNASARVRQLLEVSRE